MIQQEQYKITVYIDNEKKSFVLNESYSLSWGIFMSQASTVYVPVCGVMQNPLWVLVNDTKLVNANVVALSMFEDKSILTLQYAMETTYFKMIYDVLYDYGIYRNNEHLALIIFSLHIWLHTITNEKNIEEKIFYLMKHYPQYIMQPTTLKKCFVYMKEHIDEYTLAYEKYKAQKHKELYEE